MTDTDRRNKILERLYNERTVKLLLSRIGRGCHNLDDLEQYIYLQLLEKKPKYIIELDEKGQLNYFITGIITKQIFSNSSQFNKTYKQYEYKNELLTEFTDREL